MEALIPITVYLLILIINILVIKANQNYLENAEKISFAGFSFIPGFNILMLIILIVICVDRFLRWFLDIK